MKIEFTNNAAYERYKNIRLRLPLCCCYSEFRYQYLEGGVFLNELVSRGSFYRYEAVNENVIRVYNTYEGIDVPKYFFLEHFKNPNKLRLFFYKVFGL